MGNFIDLTGKKFNRLTVLKRVENRGKDPAWLCKCDCGNECIVVGPHLKRGDIKSCGCFHKESVACRNIVNKPAKKHGKSNERIYKVWDDMKSRCYNQNHKEYNLYGGEGKTVCDDWLHDFQAFYDWAMANGYKEGLTIERIDNTKGYSPDNCKWATYKEQANNKRNNHLITYNGKTQTMAQWADEYNVPYDKLKSRLNKSHWDIGKSLNTP